MKIMTALLTGTMMALATPAFATTFVDTGTPPTTGTTWTLSPTQSLAARFTLGSASVIDSVLGNISSAGGSTITIGLHADGADIPGALLYSGSFTSTAGQVFQGVTGQSWAVAAGSYWVSFASLGNDGMGQFAANPLADEAYAPGATAYFAFDNLDLGVVITGTAGTVPEPATWAMMIGGFGLVGGAMRRRRTTTTVRFA